MPQLGQSYLKNHHCLSIHKDAIMHCDSFRRVSEEMRGEPGRGQAPPVPCTIRSEDSTRIGYGRGLPPPWSPSSLVVIVRAGVERMWGGDPCGRPRSPFRLWNRRYFLALIASCLALALVFIATPVRALAAGGGPSLQVNA